MNFPDVALSDFSRSLFGFFPEYFLTVLHVPKGKNFFSVASPYQEAGGPLGVFLMS